MKKYLIKYKYCLIIFLTTLVVYIINFPLHSLWIGGDAFPFFYTNNFIFTQPYVWTHLAGLGGVGTTASYINYFPIIFFINVLIKVLGAFSAQYLFNFLIFLTLPLSSYYFFETLCENKNVSLVVAAFYSLNFITWFGISRNVIFITILFTLTPLILALINKYFTTNNRVYLFIIFLLSFINAVVASNPWTLLIQVLMILIFLGYSCIFIAKLPFRALVTKVFLILLLLYAASIPTLSSSYIFLRQNNSIATDYWNKKILLLDPLERQKVDSVMFNSIRGFHQDISAEWGSYDGKAYYPFPLKAEFTTTPYSVLSFLPVLLVALGGFYIKDKLTLKKYYYWLTAFLFSILLFKSAAPPFGFIFKYLILNISVFNIFRNPHLKFSFIYILSLSVLLALFFSNLKKNSLMLKALFVCVLLYTAFFGLEYGRGSFIPRNLLVKNIPNDYTQAASYINNSNDIQRTFLLPYQESTWTNTDFNYEGYSLFEYLIPKKQIFNRNDTSFSSSNALFIDYLGAYFKGEKGPLSEGLQTLNVDTLIIDLNTDTLTRFNLDNQKEALLKFLDKQENITLVKEFSSIRIYKLDRSLVKPAVSSNTKTQYTMINPTKYEITLYHVKGKIPLMFLESFHKEWKIYLQKYDDSPCARVVTFNDNLSLACNREYKFTSLSDLFLLFNNPLADKTHDLEGSYANKWVVDENYIRDNYGADFFQSNSDGSINIKILLYFKPQLLQLIFIILAAVLLAGIGLIFTFLTLKEHAK